MGEWAYLLGPSPPGSRGHRSTSVIRRHVILQLQHHDRSSLLAGKLHALLQRPYTKGRDAYDILWYPSDPQWPPPNLRLLRNALRRTGWSGPRLTETNWRALLGQRLLKLKWDRALNEVRPLLEPNAPPELLTRENVMRVLEATMP